ncbi:hypothetical protein AYK20_08965 [Thermoplasmatales archaeon SG8-52-1]|nr:MAG: hypothetical protein AYK20_08965 [Thermoplasmatales archaeon SG8-52-1]
MMKRVYLIAKSTFIFFIFLILILGSISIGKTNFEPNISNIGTDFITLISDDSQVIEINNTGSIVWQYSIGCVDSERLSNGNTLITQGFFVNEINGLGVIVWQYGAGLLGVSDVERLDNGNTLITDMLNNIVIEVNKSGCIIWQYKIGLSLPIDAERLDSGNTLIVNNLLNSVIEVSINGTIVWQYTSGLLSPSDAERLSNGNTLITDYLNNRVIEVNSTGAIVWQKTGLNSPKDAERLDNGNTLIAEYNNNRIIEVNSVGSIVGSFSNALYHPNDVERIPNQPPTSPAITGPNSGFINIPYIYMFKGKDPGGHSVYYWIEWGDGNTSGWIGPFLSDLQIPRTHVWKNKGTYTIKAKIRDVCGVESDWGTLTVKMPRDKVLSSMLFLRFLDQYPFINLLIQRLSLL